MTVAQSRENPIGAEQLIDLLDLAVLGHNLLSRSLAEDHHEAVHVGIVQRAGDGVGLEAK